MSNLAKMLELALKDDEATKPRPQTDAQAEELAHLFAAQHAQQEPLVPGTLVVEKPGLTNFTKECGFVDNTVFVIWKLLDRTDPHDAALLDCEARTSTAPQPDCLVGFIGNDGSRYCLHRTSDLQPYVPAEQPAAA